MLEQEQEVLVLSRGQNVRSAHVHPQALIKLTIATKDPNDCSASEKLVLDAVLTDKGNLSR